MTPEYFIIPFLMNYVKDMGTLTTGIYLLDILLITILGILLFTIDFKDMKHDITQKLRNNIFINKDVSIILTSNKKFTSLKYNSIMYYISNSEDRSIYCLCELVQTNWDYQSENTIEKHSIYSIDQKTNFILDKDVYGSFIKKKEIKRENSDNTTEYNEYNLLKIYTKNKNLKELIKWVNMRVIEYNKYIRSKTSDVQLLINVSNDSSNEIVIEGIPWESTITFKNSYLRTGDIIMKQINFFLNNKEWYKEKGIPYNLGILLYGEPGCGKTRFIKQLMNHTGRHGIDIKLNNNIDLNEIKKIIYNDNIGEEYIVPQDKRIIIFEDIDAIGDVVKDRSLKELQLKDINIKETLESELHKILLNDSIDNRNNKKNNIVKSLKNNSKDNNNLSFFLNIIDGLNECCGRIIVMTTNRIEYLDKALIRPGRIDIKVEFKKCDTFDIYNMIKLFWKVSIKYDMIRKELNYKYTSAEVIEIFRSTDKFDDIKDIFIV